MKYLLPLVFLTGCTMQTSGSAVGVLVHIEETIPPGMAVCHVYTSVVLQTAQSGRTEFRFTGISRTTFDAFEGKNVEVRYKTTIPAFGCDQNEVAVKET